MSKRYVILGIGLLALAFLLIGGEAISGMLIDLDQINGTAGSVVFIGNDSRGNEDPEHFKYTEGNRSLTINGTRQIFQVFDPTIGNDVLIGRNQDDGFQILGGSTFKDYFSIYRESGSSWQEIFTANQNGVQYKGVELDARYHKMDQDYPIKSIGFFDLWLEPWDTSRDTLIYVQMEAVLDPGETANFQLKLRDEDDVEKASFGRRIIRGALGTGQDTVSLSFDGILVPAGWEFRIDDNSDAGATIQNEELRQIPL